MKVIFRSLIAEEIDQAIAKANDLNQTIKCIELNESEWDEINKHPDVQYQLNLAHSATPQRPKTFFHNVEIIKATDKKSFPKLSRLAALLDDDYTKEVDRSLMTDTVKVNKAITPADPVNMKKQLDNEKIPTDSRMSGVPLSNSEYVTAFLKGSSAPLPKDSPLHSRTKFRKLYEEYLALFGTETASTAA